VPVPSQNLISNHTLQSFFGINDFRREVVVRLVVIGGIVVHDHKAVCRIP
jgi:hypothetical protein